MRREGTGTGAPERRSSVLASHDVWGLPVLVLGSKKPYAGLEPAASRSQFGKRAEKVEVWLAAIATAGLFFEAVSFTQRVQTCSARKRPARGRKSVEIATRRR